MKDDILDYVFTQEEILVLVYKLIEKLHEITEEVNELQAQQSKDNETKLADMRVELEEFARQIGVFAQNTKDEQDRLVGELEKLDEVVEAKVSDASADIDAAVDELEDRIEALRAEIPVLKEKTGSELMSLIGTIPFDRVEGLAEIARQLNSFSEVVHEERSDDSEFVKGELARVEERIDNLPTYEDKFKELNADMYKLSQELVNITPRIEVFVDGNKYASVHRLNFVGSTVTNDNGLVTVTNNGVAGATAWGAITGTLSNQTDLQTALNAKEPANANIQSHIGDTNNPHGVTQTQVGLGNVDNTSDANKPISTATQNALDAKATLQETDDILSTGLVSGGALTAGTGASINIASGVGWVNHAGTHQRVTWNAFTNQTSVTGGTNYVGIDSSGAVSISATRQDNSTIYLGNFYVDTGQSMVIEVFSVPEYTGDFIAKMNNWLVDTVGTLIQDGSYVQEQSNPNYLKLSISGGSMHARLGEYAQGTATTFTKMYNTADYGWVPDSGSANTVSTSHWNNTANNMSTALVAMTTNYWKKDMVLRLANGNVYYIYGQAEYATEDLAKASPLPQIPDEIRNDTALLAIIVSKQGDTTIANRLYDIRPLLERIFGYGTAGASGAVIDHGSLTGLGDDDHAQYHNDTRGDARYVQKNAAITGATKTKITYDSKGLVTTSADATTADIADSTNRRYVTDAQLAVLNKDEFGITVDGSGTVITTGTKGLRPIGYNCTITGWQLVGNISGSVVFDVKRNGTSLAGTEKPTLSTQQTNSDTTLTTWTTSLTAGDIIEFVIDSASTITRATLTILVTKN